MPPIDPAQNIPSVDTSQAHKLIPTLVVVALILGAGFALFYNRGLIPGEQMVIVTSDESCEQKFWDSSLPKAQQQMVGLQVAHPDVTVLEMALNVFYSPTVQGCVVSSFARLQSVVLLQAEQFPDAFFQTIGPVGTTIGYFFEAATGRAITPDLPEWESVLADLDASEARKTTAAEAIRRTTGDLIVPTDTEGCTAAFWRDAEEVASGLEESGTLATKTLFYSPSLKQCIAFIHIDKGREQEIFTFNAATGEFLNAEDNMYAISDLDDIQQAATAESEL